MVVETAPPQVQKAGKLSQSAGVGIAPPPAQPGEGKFAVYPRMEEGRFSAGTVAVVAAVGTVVVVAAVVVVVVMVAAAAVVVAVGQSPALDKMSRMGGFRHCRIRRLVEEFHQSPVVHSGTLVVVVQTPVGNWKEMGLVGVVPC